MPERDHPRLGRAISVERLRRASSVTSRVLGHTWPSKPLGDETPFVAALDRAVALQRFKATDVRSILQEVNVSLLWVPQSTFDNLAGLE